MTKLMLAATLTLLAAVSAQAQVSRRPNPEDNTRQAALSDPDPIRREERLISISSRELSGPRRAADAPPFANVSTFKAQLDITNRGSKTIKSVSWLATLTDPATGALIRTYNIETKRRIAPGATKKLEKKLPTPRAHTVSAAPGGRKSPVVADLKSTIIQITYEDGSTSEKP
ncbi:MAG TPA: hypothetical protein VEY11_02930 [Pyrinomonadaceae bacterium]|nr:hypothetical protein [Pyrinomonadaceae bacterium]